MSTRLLCIFPFFICVSGGWVFEKSQSLLVLPLKIPNEKIALYAEYPKNCLMVAKASISVPLANTTPKSPPTQAPSKLEGPHDIHPDWFATELRSLQELARVDGRDVRKLLAEWYLHESDGAVKPLIADRMATAQLSLLDEGVSHIIWGDSSISKPPVSLSEGRSSAGRRDPALGSASTIDYSRLEKLVGGEEAVSVSLDDASGLEIQLPDAATLDLDKIHFVPDLSKAVGLVESSILYIFVPLSPFTPPPHSPGFVLLPLKSEAKKKTAFVSNRIKLTSSAVGFEEGSAIPKKSWKSIVHKLEQGDDFVSLVPAKAPKKTENHLKASYFDDADLSESQLPPKKTKESKKLRKHIASSVFPSPSPLPKLRPSSPLKASYFEATDLAPDNSPPLSPVRGGKEGSQEIRVQTPKSPKALPDPDTKILESFTAKAANRQNVEEDSISAIPLSTEGSGLPPMLPSSVDPARNLENDETLTTSLLKKVAALTGKGSELLRAHEKRVRKLKLGGGQEESWPDNNVLMQFEKDLT